MDFLTAAAIAIFSGLFGYQVRPTAGLEVIKVVFENDKSNGCIVKSVGKHVKAKNADQDVLVVQISNRCKAEQKVTVSDNTDSDISCVGSAAGVVIGAEFPVPYESKAHLFCKVTYTAAKGYEFFVTDTTRAPRVASEIAIEDVPLR